MPDALVMVVHGNGKHLLGLFLTDNVLVQRFLDFRGQRQVLDGRQRAAAHLFGENPVTHQDAFIADVYVRTRDEAFHLVGVSVAEGTAKVSRRRSLLHDPVLGGFAVQGLGDSPGSGGFDHVIHEAIFDSLDG